MKNPPTLKLEFRVARSKCRDLNFGREIKFSPRCSAPRARGRRTLARKVHAKMTWYSTRADSHLPARQFAFAHRCNHHFAVLATRINLFRCRMTQALANPTTSDGMGNYNFYAAPGRYVIEISGPSISTRQVRDVILPNDPSQPTTFSSITTPGNISGFTLSLAGNLTVAGSAAVTGTLTVGGAPVPSTGQANTWSASQTFKGPSPWRDVTAFGAKCDGSTDDTAAFQAAFNAALADPGGTVYIPWSPASSNGCIVKSGITIPAHGYWLNVLQVGNITIPTGGSSLIDSGAGATNRRVLARSAGAGRRSAAIIWGA